MSYPNYTFKEQCGYFFSRYLGMTIHVILGALLAVGAVLLGHYGIIWSWVASPIALFGWGYVNFIFWGYQGWRSSGPRGRLVNPYGPSSTDVKTAVIWLSFGVFFHLYHVWLRSDFRHRRLPQKES